MSPTPHCFNRQFEWITALMMLGIALTIYFSPDTITHGGFYLVQRVGLTAPVIWALFTLGGALRMTSLYANGHWPVYGPRMRIACAAGGALMWFEMSIALFEWSHHSGYVSIGVPVYGLLCIGELISCYRAASDGRSR